MQIGSKILSYENHSPLIALENNSKKIFGSKTL